jgi:hypothetical protein
MGISTNFYTVYGVRIEYDNELSDILYDGDELINQINDSPDIDIIADFMAAEYFVVGKLLFKGGDMRWGDIDDTWTETEYNALPEIKEKALSEFKRILPKFAHFVEEQEWKIITFMHLS